jgi:hypothetical protein
MSKILKYFLMISLLAITFTYSQFAQAEKAEMIPVGSYQKSCVDIKVKKNMLKASCTTLSGSVNKTKLKNLSACLNSISQNGDIGNIDGSLICLPDLPIVDQNFTFPKSETQINAWIYGNDLSNIYKHAWGIWDGLTSPVGNVDGVPVRAFETWNTPTNILSQIGNLAKSSSMQSSSQSLHPAKLKLELKPPKRFNKRRFKSKKKVNTKGDGDTSIAVSVAFNPPGARHLIINKLLLESTLKRYLKEGYTEIPNYPLNTIVVKPVYKIITSKNAPNGIYTFPGWPGTPSPAKTFSEKDWGSCVYVDIKKSGPGGNSIDKGCKKQSRANTFHLNNFIHQKINKEDAQYLTDQLGLNELGKVEAGDYAILVGMHVTTREIKRWTWQTFWWSANPDNPYLPSSNDIASYRPKTMGKAPRHYAMSVAYQMVSPAQPIIGGENSGSPVIGYNPHLEAGFDPATFQIIRAINGANGPIIHEYGVQTNCMSCHNLAMYNPKTNYVVDQGANTEKPYGTDFYMSITDEVFNNSLKLDFSWAILGNLKLNDGN